MAISDDTVRASRDLWTREVPLGWSFRRFGDALELVRRPVTVDDDRMYTQPVIRRRHGGLEVRANQLGRDIKTKAQFEIRHHDWLMSKVQILHGAYGVVPEELDGAIASGSYYSFRVRENLDLNFLWYLSQLHQFHRTCALASVGVVIEKMVFRVEDWLSLEFPLPPLAEQKKIAAILSSVDEAIRANEAVIEQTRRVKEGLLQELLTRGIGHTEFRETEIGPLPVGWDVRPLHQVCSRVGVGIASAATHAYSDKGVPLIRNQNIKPGRLDLSDLLYVTDWYDRENATKRLVAGDVLTIRTGYPGVSAVVPDSLDGAQSFTTLVSRPESDLIDSSFLAAWINSPLGRGFVLRGKAGGAQHNLNSGTLRELRCPLPSLDEQREIMCRLDAVASAEQSQEKAVERLRSLKSGLLQDLLTGKVRVSP